MLGSSDLINLGCILNHLLITVPNQAANVPYLLDAIRDTIDFIFDGPGRYFQPLSDFSLQGAALSPPLFSLYVPYPAHITPAPQLTPSPPVVKTKDFNTLFKCMTQMIITALNT